METKALPCTKCEAQVLAHQMLRRYQSSLIDGTALRTAPLRNRMLLEDTLYIQSQLNVPGLCSSMGSTMKENEARLLGLYHRCKSWIRDNDVNAIAANDIPPSTDSHVDHRASAAIDTSWYRTDCQCAWNRN